MRRGLATLFLCACGALVGVAQPSGRVPLTEVLAQLEAQAGYRFSYREDALAELRLDTAFAKTWPAVLAQLEASGLLVEQVGPTAFLIARAPAAVAPERTLTWVVRGADGPLVGATALADDGRGWATDPQGRLVLSARDLPDALTVAYLGYRSRTFSRKELLAQTSPLTLTPSPLTFGPVLVTAPLPTRTLMSVQRTQTAETGFGESRIALPPAAFGNLGFVGLAGASGIDGASAKPQVRGSGAEETLVLLDGLPLYHVDHFFGLFAALHPPMVERVDVFRSHYPSEQGGYRGGLMRVESREASEPALVLNADQVSAAATSTLRAGKFGLLLSGRTTLNGLVRDSVFGALTPDFRFRDGYARATWGNAGDRWRAEANAFASRDAYDFEATDLYEVAGTRAVRTYRGVFGEQTRWANEGLRAAVHYAAGGVRLTLDGYATAYEQGLTTSSTFQLARRPNAPVRTLLDSDLDNRIAEQQVGLRLADARGDTSRWALGVQLQHLSTDARYRIGRRVPLDADQSDVRIHGFGRYRLPLARRLHLSLGLRATRSLDEDLAWLSPRVQLTAPVSKRTQLRTGYSYTRQNVRALQHENQYGQTYPVYVLDVQGRGEEPAAHNLTAGARHERGGLQLDVEAYHRWLPGVLAVRSTTLGVRRDTSLFDPQPVFATFSGEGRVIGVDLDVRYRLGSLDGQVAYTLASSRQRFAGVAGRRWQRAPDDRRHRLATSHQYRTGPWRLSLACELASGLVYTDVNALDDVRSVTDLEPSAYQRALPSYARVDVGGHYRTSLGPAEVTAGLRLFNALDRDNVSHREYIVGLASERGNGRRQAMAVGTDITLLGRLLLLEVEVKF